METINLLNPVVFFNEGFTIRYEKTKQKKLINISGEAKTRTSVIVHLPSESYRV